MTSVMRPDPRYELALASQVPHTQTEHPDTSAEAVTFLLIVNDLPDWISSNIRMSADDTKIWCIIKEIDDGLMLQSDLDNLVKWSDKI